VNEYNEIIEKLAKDLKKSAIRNGDSYDDDTIMFFSEININSFASFRNYPSGYTEEKIIKDMKKCYGCIYKVADKMLSKQGADYESSHSENTVNRTWETDSDIYISCGVFPFAGSFN